jgi:hypothetical protein
MKKKPSIPENVLEFFRRTGAQGGKKRAARHSKQQLRAWGKMGGRPKGTGKKQKRQEGVE